MSVTRLLAFVCALLVAACSSSTPAPSDSRIQVVTTISTFNSMVEAVGGNLVRVTNLVPVGASPETYQPTPQDVATLSRAQLLVENGAGLETWLGKTIANVGSSNLRTVVCTDGLPVRNNNPHLWLNPVYAKQYVMAIRDGLMKMDPQHGSEYRSNARRYAATLDDLDKSIARRISTIPKNQRAMIVFHNAWQYYNDRYGIQSLGFIEPNPGQDPNPQQIATLITLAKQHNVRAIFSEPEYSPKLARQIAGNANIKIVDNLYDDSIGTDPRVGNYTSMMNYNTNIIVKSLR